MELIVQNAITAERLVKARKALRREPRSKGEVFSQNKDFKRGTYVSQTFNVEEDTKAGITRNPQFQIICQLCDKLGHTANNCRNKPNEVNYAQTICQMCNLNEHSAKQCKRMIKCQACGNLGHSARQCQFGNSGTNTCQIFTKVGNVANQCFQFKIMSDRSNPRIEARAQFSCQICERSGHTATTCRVKLDKTCAYCKTKGHVNEESRKRQYNGRIRSGIGLGLLNTSANTETQQNQMRSTNFIQTEEAACELLPLE